MHYALCIYKLTKLEFCIGDQLTVPLLILLSKAPFIGTGGGSFSNNDIPNPTPVIINIHLLKMC